MDNFSMKIRIITLCSLVFLLAFGQSAIAEEKFGGIGAQVVPVSTGDLTVLHVIPGSPAEQGGLLPGDLIIEVNELKMQGSDFDLVTKKYLWGRVGTSVSLVWLRPGIVGQMRTKLERVDFTNDMKVKSTPGVSISTPQ